MVIWFEIWTLMFNCCVASRCRCYFRKSSVQKKKKDSCQIHQKPHVSVQLWFSSVHPSILVITPSCSQFTPYRKFRATSDSPIMNWTSPLFFSFHSGPEPVVHSREILCSCWEEMASIHQSCCQSQTSASPSPDPVSVGWLRLLIPAPSCFCASIRNCLFTFVVFFLLFRLSSYEDWLWKHGGEDGVQWEVCQQGVFQLQATGQPGAADHQTKQRRRFLF